LQTPLSRIGLFDRAVPDFWGKPVRLLPQLKPGKTPPAERGLPALISGDLLQSVYNVTTGVSF